MDDDLLWGESAVDKDHARSPLCENRDCERYNDDVRDDRSELVERAIGVRVASSFSRKGDYVVIFECPGCFSKYWIHIGEDTAKKIKEYQEG